VSTLPTVTCDDANCYADRRTASSKQQPQRIKAMKATEIKAGLVSAVVLRTLRQSIVFGVFAVIVTLVDNIKHNVVQRIFACNQCHTHSLQRSLEQRQSCHH
jgi:transcription initiation factor IIE alpha subunit